MHPRGRTALAHKPSSISSFIKGARGSPAIAGRPRSARLSRGRAPQALRLRLWFGRAATGLDVLPASWRPSCTKCDAHAPRRPPHRLGRGHLSRKSVNACLAPKALSAASAVSGAWCRPRSSRRPGSPAARGSAIETPTSILTCPDESQPNLVCQGCLVNQRVLAQALVMPGNSDGCRSFGEAVVTA